MFTTRRSLVMSCAGVFALSAGLSAAPPNKPRLMFIQQDKIVAFDPGTGLGGQTGTALGDITGVTTVNFQFTITSFPNFTYNNRTGITDVDGDQIIFKSTGTGHFLLPGLPGGLAPLSDPTLGGSPGSAPFQVFGNGLGGPLVGTYEVLATSGKYVKDFPIGAKFPSKGVMYNPSTPPMPPGTVGSAYIEVYDNK